MRRIQPAIQPKVAFFPDKKMILVLSPEGSAALDLGRKRRPVVSFRKILEKVPE